MEFKGTRGKWTRYTASVPSIEDKVSHSVYIGTQRISLCYDLFENDKSKNVNKEEAPYNAQLISKAPELLDTVNELLELLSFHGYNNSTEIYKAKELIEEATKID